MAVRYPLKLDGSNNLIEMSTADLEDLHIQAAYLYGLNPSVTLSQVASGGNLGTISDTRKTAGSYSTSTTAFVPETSTAEPGTVTVNYSRINSTTTTIAAPTDTGNIAFPVYNDGGNIRAMTAQDMIDTFAKPAIDLLTNGTDQPGIYRIHTSTSLAGHTLVSSTPVFTDTRANTSLYTAAGIPEALDQPQTVTNFYLFVKDAGVGVTYTSFAPLLITSGSYHLQQYPTATFDSILSGFVRHTASSVVGSKIAYNINGAGNNRGSGMTNTVLNGAGNYQQLFVNADDYRSQEFPDGTAVTAATYYLKIVQA